MKLRTLALLVATLPGFALAEDVASQPATPEKTATGEHFMSLENVRAGKPTTIKQMKPLRGDSSAMNSGYFRIDRSRTIPLKSGGPLIVRPSDNASTDMPRIIRGPGPSAPVAALEPEKLPLSSISPRFDGGARVNANTSDPILSLFEGDSGAPPSSFRTALTGSSAGSTQLGEHQWPIPTTAAQRVSSNYGFRSDPFNKDTKFHGGVDIAAPIGTPVLASADGQVASVGTEGGYGKTIAILHADGSESRYSHLDTHMVSQGQQVRAGQKIGTVGSSGHSTGPHLDYRLSQDGVSVDPLKVSENAKNAVPSAVAPAPIAAQPRIRTQTAKNDRLIIVK